MDMANAPVFAQRAGPKTVATHLAEVDALSAKVEASQKTTVSQAPDSTPSWLAEITPYAPFLVSGFLFVAAFGIMLIGKIRDAKNVSAALLVAFFAASIPQILFSITIGTRQSAQAGPQETPRNIRVSSSLNAVTVAWETQKTTYGAVRYSVSPFTEKTAKTAVEASRKAETIHTVILSPLVAGRSYELEILSGNVWYDNQGEPLRFIFSFQ